MAAAQWAAADGFGTTDVSTSADGPQAVFAVDLDGDGLVDVASADANNNMVSWYKNGGGAAPVWTRYTVADTVRNPYGVSGADIDRDGRVDLLSAAAGDGRVIWHRNTPGSPVAWTLFNVSTASMGANGLFSADLDADGWLDVVSANKFANSITWFRNSGGVAANITWTAYVVASTGLNGPVSVYAVDVDRDGKVDALSASQNDGKVTWYRNGGASSWTAYPITTLALGANCVFAADLDGDGWVDAMSARCGTWCGRAHRVCVCVGHLLLALGMSVAMSALRAVARPGEEACGPVPPPSPSPPPPHGVCLGWRPPHDSVCAAV